MSRTYKRYTGGCFRSPRGHRQALVAGVRASKVPPSAWDDVSFDKTVFLPHIVAAGLAAKAVNPQDIVRHLMKKFKMRLSDAEYWASNAVLSERRKVPFGLLGVYCEKELKQLPNGVT